MDVRFIWTAAKSELGAGRSLVSSHPAEDLPEAELHSLLGELLATLAPIIDTVAKGAS